MILNSIIILSLLKIIFISLISNKLLVTLKKYLLCFFFIYLFFSLILFFNFNNLYLSYNFFNICIWSEFFNFNYIFGIDSISSLFIILTIFLSLLCFLYSWNQFQYCFKELTLLLYLVEFLLINFFISMDFFFFFFFETILFPMFFIIGNFGSRQRKIHASLQFFFFTMSGSFLMIFSILMIYLHEGTTNINLFYFSNLDFLTQNIIWFCLFISLSVKVPLFPFHLWLPEAHVEAPTVGSVILAGVLLKMGTYGIYRFLLPIFIYSNFFFNPLIFLLCFLSIYYVSIITFCQIDLKKLIAYSSISHMGFVILGLFNFSFQGLQGSLFLMLSHGIVSGLLFFLIGMLYDRYKTRIIFFYKSLHTFMPVFIFGFFFATLANIGFPGTIGFIGEFLLMFSFIYSSKIIFFFSCLGFLTSLPYAFWLYNRISFFLPFSIFVFSDISKRECFIIFSLVFLVFFGGLYPSFIFNFLEFNVLNIYIINYIIK